MCSRWPAISGWRCEGTGDACWPGAGRGGVSAGQGEGPSSRIATRFAALRAEGRGALIPFVEAGDPDPDTSFALLAGLPAAGADLIEIGVPFTDPMADGPIIQRAGQRALKAGATLAGTLGMVRRFRHTDAATPIVLMGYFNPILAYGVERFAADAAAAGVDGLIVVDLPPEEAEELALPARAQGLDLIRLIAPTTDDARLPRILAGTSGFLYHVAIAGITGTRSATAADLATHVARIRPPYRPADRDRLRHQDAGTGGRGRAHRRCGGGRLGTDRDSGRPSRRRGPGHAPGWCRRCWHRWPPWPRPCRGRGVWAELFPHAVPRPSGKGAQVWRRREACARRRGRRLLLPPRAEEGGPACLHDALHARAGRAGAGRARLALAAIDGELLLEAADVAIGAHIIAQEEPPAPIASVSTARIAGTRRSARAPTTVWAERRGLMPARYSASQT